MKYVIHFFFQGEFGVPSPEESGAWLSFIAFINIPKMWGWVNYIFRLRTQKFCLTAWIRAKIYYRFTMNLTDLISNPDYHHISEQILNSLNYQELINCCQASSTLECYIKNHNFKWQLLERLHELKLKAKNLHGFVPENLFNYYETSGTTQELSLIILILNCSQEQNWDLSSPLIYHKIAQLIQDLT